MQDAALQLDRLNPAVLKYIHELEAYKYKYLELKERYDVLIYSELI